MDLISIIVPVYNKINYLKNCLNSLEAQTYKKIEIILVDDGSTDGSGIICDEYDVLFDNISVYHKINGGVSSARNFGMKKANGKYIFFIDADDEVMPNYIEKMYTTLIKENVDIVICSIRERYYLKNGDIKLINRHLECKKGNILNDFSKLYFDDNFYLGANCLKIYKSSIIKEYGLQFKEDLSSGEDYVFNLEYYECINTYCTISDILYIYNLYQKIGTAQERLNNSRINNEHKILEITKKYIEKHNLEKNIILGETTRILKVVINIIFSDKNINLKSKYLLFIKILNKLNVNEFIDINYRTVTIKRFIVFILLKLRLYRIFFFCTIIKYYKTK